MRTPSRLPGTATRKRTGCLGCLTQVLLVLVAGSVFLVLLQGVLYPWSFYLGGRFHPMPGWQGAGTMHTAAGDYMLRFWISPERGGRTYNFPYFSGWGYLCTPRGEKYRLRVTGGLHEHTGLDTNGKEMHLTLHQRPWYWNLTGTWEERPRLDLRGPWQNPDLVLNDGGTLSQAFLPDGTLYTGPPSRQPAAREKVQIVMHEVSWTDLSTNCPK